MSGVLFVVGTPIGNLADVTDRCRQIFCDASFIVCEDTRVTSKLCAHWNVQPRLRSLNEHASAKVIDEVCDAVARGKRVAYVSDAGTPGMNDPGGKLVARAFDRDLLVRPIPGVSALTTAISVCGFPMDEFIYLGFAPLKKGRKSFFEAMHDRRTPTIFLESTHRITKTLDALYEILDPDRLIFVGREMTKMFETYYRGTAEEVRNAIAQTSTKGELTIVIGPKMRKVKN